MYNPIKATFNPLYKFEMALEDIRKFIKRMKRIAADNGTTFDLKNITLGNPTIANEFLRLLKKAKQRLEEVKIGRKGLTEHQEKMCIEMITEFGRIVSEAGVKVP